MKKNVLILIDSLGEGGAQKIIADIINGVYKDVNVYLVALYWFEFEKKYYTELSKKCKLIKTIGKPTHTKFEKLIYRTIANLNFYNFINKIIKKYEIGLVHTNLYHSNKVGCKIKKDFSNIKLLATYHSNFAHKNKKDNINILNVLKCHDNIFCDLKVGYHDLITTEINDNIIEYIPFGIDSKYFYYNIQSNFDKNSVREKYKIDRDDVVFLSISRIVFFDRKVDEFIKAFSLIKRKIYNAKLIIIGTGQDLEAAKNLAKELNIDDSVMFLGHKSNLEEFYSLADYYFSYTVFDEIGIAGQQAIASGLITFSITMNKSTKSNNLYFIDALEYKELSKLVINNISNNHNNYSDKIIEDFNNENMINKYLEYYKNEK